MNGVTGQKRDRWRAVVAGLSAVALLAGSAASARADDGIGGFFQQLFGGGGRAAVEPLPQPDYASPEGPPLTVRARKHRRPTGARMARATRYTPEELKAVTIYTDRTLVRGDAVMTAKGLRIFNGSSALPHSEDDFTALSSTDRMPKTIRRELSAIDIASRSDFRGN